METTLFHLWVYKCYRILMIQDARVLKEDHVPGEVVERNSELNALSGALEPIEEGESAESAFLFGPSGTGKTFLAKFMLGELEREVLDVNTQFLNCWQDYTRYRVLYEVLDGFASTVNIHRQSTATDKLLNQVQHYDGPPYVVVLDEVDQLEDKEVLYDLYKVGNLSMILISNREKELFTHLDNRLVSRLHGARRIQLQKYHLNELADILEQRTINGLERDAIDRRQLELISDLAAGDARIGIAILRSAAREAESRGADKITSEIIKSVAPEARDTVQQKTINQLREHQRVLYEVLDEHGELNPGELYCHYQESVDDPKTDRTVRNYLKKMEHYNLLIAEGEKRGRTYRAKNPDDMSNDFD